MKIIKPAHPSSCTIGAYPVKTFVPMLGMNTKSRIFPPTAGGIPRSWATAGKSVSKYPSGIRFRNSSS